MCMQPRQLCLGCWGGEVLSTPYSAIPRAKDAYVHAPGPSDGI